jgi:hypothetical protein
MEAFVQQYWWLILIIVFIVLASPDAAKHPASTQSPERSKCPKCGRDIGELKRTDDYCPGCGQRLQ